MVWWLFGVVHIRLRDLYLVACAFIALELERLVEAAHWFFVSLPLALHAFLIIVRFSATEYFTAFLNVLVLAI